jgi:integrase
MDYEHQEKDHLDEPGVLVFEVPVLLPGPTFAGRSRGESRMVLCPILALRPSLSEEVHVPSETLAWANHLLRKKEPVKSIRRRLNSVGRLWEFAEIALSGAPIDAESIDQVIYEYLSTRAENPIDPGRRFFKHWQPIRLEAVQREFKDLQDFASFCRDHKLLGSVIGRAFGSVAIWPRKYRAARPEEFFAHLRIERARWNEILGEDQIISLPKDIRNVSSNIAGRKDPTTTALSQEQVDEIIDQETNISFRALWILLAYMGPRISEALNLWACDVLDGESSRRLFATTLPGPLVVFAHPEQSTYTGALSPHRKLINRTEYLRSHYGLKPRTLDEGKARVGWKGMMIFNPDLKISPGTWSCLKRASEFEMLAQEIRLFHVQMETGKRHPYFFINVKNREFYGGPLQLSNVEKAFERACRRTGVEPYTPGASLHGLRHYYTWYIENILKISDEKQIQLVLRQTNVRSQDVYGKRAADLWSAMDRFNRRDER